MFPDTVKVPFFVPQRDDLELDIPQLPQRLRQVLVSKAASPTLNLNLYDPTQTTMLLTIPLQIL
jgi:hypothetical protein